MTYMTIQPFYREEKAISKVPILGNSVSEVISQKFKRLYLKKR